MIKYIFSIVIFFSFSLPLTAQETREELEKQRTKLKKEMEQTQALLNSNKAKTKESLVQWKLINDKVNLQNKLIENISKDINLLDNKIINNQREINRYNRLLDTLKEEYARSMIYAYKNRNSYDFLSFIFSSASFNDAIKRITYLKYYRTYREKQGENILRTQNLRRQRVNELGNMKEQKNEVLQIKDKEVTVLETQKQAKDKIVLELQEEDSYCSSISVNITARSSIPDSESIMETSVAANSYKVFRGYIPTSFYFKMTPSLFKSYVSEYNDDTGYHVSVDNNPLPGSEYLISE